MPNYPNLGSVAGGMIDTQMDLQNIQMNDVKLQDSRIQLQRDKISLAQQVKLLGLMSGFTKETAQSGSNAQATPSTLSDYLTRMSMMQLESGLPDEATKTATAATRLAENASKIDYRSYRMQTDRLTKFANVLTQVDDSPQGFASAMRVMLAQDPSAAQDQKFAALMQQGWRPGLIPMLKNEVVSARDRAEIEYKQKQEQHLLTQEKVDTARVDLIRAQTRVANEREAKLQKEGITPYKAEQLKAITDQATRDFPTADPADVRVRSRPIAENVMKMIKDQHLTLSEAATRAYEQARSSGVFSGLRTAPEVKGSKPGLAMPLPTDPSKIRENSWYMVNGQPRLAVGYGFDKKTGKVTGNFYSEDELDKIDKEDEAEDNAEDEEEAQ